MPENFENRDQEENLPIEKTEEQKESEIELDRQRINRELFGDVNVDGITEQNENKEVINLIEQEIAKRFPMTYDRMGTTSWKEFCGNLREAYKDSPQRPIIENGISDIELSNKRQGTEYKMGERPINKVWYWYLHEKHRGRHLHQISAFLKGDVLDENNVGEDIEQQIRGKKILVLGDDTGSLTEILNSFGATAIGIENSEFKVMTAHSGVLAEEGKPQKQVRQGDIGDLTDKTSDLYKEIERLGPFDIVYSNSVFNSGSGIEETIEKYGRKNKIYDAVEKERHFGIDLTNNLMQITNDDGFILHAYTDIDRMFGRYSVRGSAGPAQYSEGTGHDKSLVFIPKNKFKGFSGISDWKSKL